MPKTPLLDTPLRLRCKVATVPGKGMHVVACGIPAGKDYISVSTVRRDVIHTQEVVPEEYNSFAWGWFKEGPKIQPHELGRPVDADCQLWVQAKVQQDDDGTKWFIPVGMITRGKAVVCPAMGAKGSKELWLTVSEYE